VTDGAHAAEQIVVYDENEGTVEIVARSSLRNGVPVLTQAEAQRIYRVMMTLPTDAFGSSSGGGGGGGSANALDVEFVVVGEQKRELLLLQCRPCSYR
jgi:hypothetical protein